MTVSRGMCTKTTLGGIVKCRKCKRAINLARDDEADGIELELGSVYVYDNNYNLKYIICRHCASKVRLKFKNSQGEPRFGDYKPWKHTHTD
jgi:DNA-directed RNA polymerase subunit RPC12/RpoP